MVLVVVHARFIQAVAQRAEAHGGVEILYHGILGRWDIFADDARDSCFPCGAEDGIGDKLFHAALEYAAAHQPFVYEQLVFAFFQNDHGDQSVLAEAVAQGVVAGDVTRIRRDFLNFLLAVAHGAQVELV